MKKQNQITLLQKTSKVFILVSGLLIILSLPILYFFISRLMEKEVEEELFSRSFRLEHYVTENKQLLELPPVFEVVRTKQLAPVQLKDTLIYDPSQDEMEVFRELNTFREINGKNYRITVRSMAVETRDIILVTLAYFMISLLLVFIIQFYFSRAWNRRIWQPFFSNLEAMKSFSLESGKALKLSESKITEFSELKAEIAALTSKVIADYQNLKQFTENISHELQSSLAIMQAKLGNFLDGSHLTDEQFQHLSSLQRDIQRLGLLNKKLVLLATLEQRQSRDFETVDLNAVTKESVENFQEISTIPITLKEKNKILVRVDKELLRVLIDNLISNAIRHSSEGGKIEIEIQDAAFTIRNSGERELENSEKIFDRFYKANPKVKVGSGLGLAIIKKVCSVFDYELSYTYEHGMHQFKVIIN